MTDNSPLVRRTLNQAGFSYRYELDAARAPSQPPAAQTTATPIVDEVLRAGDVVLVQGKDEEIARLKDSGELLVLDATTDLPHTKKAPLAFAFMLMIVVLAATKILPIFVAALIGVVAMLVTGLHEAARCAARARCQADLHHGSSIALCARAHEDRRRATTSRRCSSP